MGIGSEMVDHVISAMAGRRPMNNSEIYHAVKAVCETAKRPLAANWQEQVREVLQAHCAGTKTWERRGRPGDFFVHHERGVWSCKVKSRTDDLLSL